MPDYQPKTWGSGDQFTAGEATAMSQELEEQEQKDVEQDAALASGLAGKVDKISTPNRAYLTDSSGAQSTREVTDSPTPGSIPVRAASGNFQVAAATASKDVVNREQMDASVDRKLDKSTASSSAYVTSAGGGQLMVGRSSGPDPSTMMQREANGRSKVAAGIASNDIANKGQMDNADLLFQTSGQSLYADPNLTDVDFWAGLPDGISLSTEQIYRSARSFKFVQRQTPINLQAILHHPPGNAGSYAPIAVNSNDTVYCEFWVFVPVAIPTGNIGVALRVTDSSGTNSTTQYPWAAVINASAIPAGVWTKVTGSPKIPTGYDSAAAYVQMLNTTPAGSVAYVSGGVVLRISDNSKADKITGTNQVVTTDSNGNMSQITRTASEAANTIMQRDANGRVGITAGTSSNHATTKSQMDAQDTRIMRGENLVYDPQFADPASWIFGSFFQFSTERFLSGTRSIKFTSPPDMAQGVVNLLRNPVGTARDIECRPLDEFYVEIWVNLPSTITAGQIGISGVYKDSKGVAAIGYTPATYAALSNIPANSWVKIANVLKVPSTYDMFGALIVCNGGIPSGGVIYVDRPVIIHLEPPLAWPTAARPAAGNFNAGREIWNTTTNRPNWSDGTNWRDATGAIV